VLSSANYGKPSASIAETNGRPIENLDRGSTPKTNPKVVYWFARPGASVSGPGRSQRLTFGDIFGEK